MPTNSRRRFPMVKTASSLSGPHFSLFTLNFRQGFRNGRDVDFREPYDLFRRVEIEDGDLDDAVRAGD